MKDLFWCGQARLSDQAGVVGMEEKPGLCRWGEGGRGFDIDFGVWVWGWPSSALICLLAGCVEVVSTWSFFFFFIIDFFTKPNVLFLLLAFATTTAYPAHS